MAARTEADSSPSSFSKSIKRIVASLKKRCGCRLANCATIPNAASLISSLTIIAFGVMIGAPDDEDEDDDDEREDEDEEMLKEVMRVKMTLKRVEEHVSRKSLEQEEMILSMSWTLLLLTRLDSFEIP